MTGKLFRLGELFCGTVALHYAGDHLPMDDRSFALVVDELKEKGNETATHFWTFNGPAGRTCPDFDQMLSLAFHASLVSYLSPRYSHFLSNLSPHGANAILKRIEATDDELREMKEIVDAYLSRVR